MSLRTVFNCFGLVVLTCLFCQCTEDLGEVDSSVRASNLVFGKCDHRNHMNQKDRQCREWTGVGFENYDLESSCDAIDDGTFAMGSCPQGNLVGICILNQGQFLETLFYYYDDAWDELEASDSCENKDLVDITGESPSRWLPASP